MFSDRSTQRISSSRHPIDFICILPYIRDPLRGRVRIQSIPSRDGFRTTTCWKFNRDSSPRII
jgi:hypothetical protein